jgi:FAD:protein FMN transferase
MRKSIILLSLLFLLSCKSTQQRDYIKLSGFAQGTTYSITYYDLQKRNFELPIENLLEKVDSSMSLYRENSVINAFNNSISGIGVDSLLAEVVELSKKINLETEGAFDITVGPLVRAWGFHAKKGGIPDEETIQKHLKHIGSDKISIDGLNLKKTLPEVIIDVNAIAQGYTVDLIAEFFDQNGVKDYLVELGGEIRTRGISPRGKGWLVGIDKPVDNALSGDVLQAIVSLSGESLVTSGNYRKFFVREGIKYSHTINPKTGYPVTHSLLSATVIDERAARTDALATAFMVMGLDKTKKWLEKNPKVDAYLIFSNPEGDYEIWMTPGFAKRITE